jgi:hypothetical protein
MGKTPQSFGELRTAPLDTNPHPASPLTRGGVTQLKCKPLALSRVRGLGKGFKPKQEEKT